MYDTLLNYVKYMKFSGGHPQIYYPMSYIALISQLLLSATSLNRDLSNII